jgi:hypothetical protein
MASNNIKTVIVIGGGLVRFLSLKKTESNFFFLEVGSLCGIFMAKRGYHVTIFEYREGTQLFWYYRY